MLSDWTKLGDNVVLTLVSTWAEIPRTTMPQMARIAAAASLIAMILPIFEMRLGCLPIAASEFNKAAYDPIAIYTCWAHWESTSL